MTDFAAEGLLEGLEGAARTGRERLLQALVDDGCTLDELKEAAAEDRLVLLPVDRALAVDSLYTPRELAEKSGIDLDTLKSSQAAFGLPVTDDDERAYGETALEVTKALKALLDAGIPLERIEELSRVIGRAMHQVAASSRSMVAETLLRPGLGEDEVAAMYSGAARHLAPQMAPALAYAYERHLRELLRSDAVSAAAIAEGRPDASREVTVAFADLVGFTRLGEELPAEDVGALAHRLEHIASDLVSPPVTLVKSVGDAVMLVSQDTDRVLDTTLELIDAAAAEGEGFPQLRVGLAHGNALERAGDWYGSPVNTASRVTGVARAGSVLATKAVRDEAQDGWRWSFAGERRLKGVGPTPLYRARRAEQQQ